MSSNKGLNGTSPADDCLSCMSVKPRRLKSYTPFINEACGADETLVLIARLHWIFVVKGLAWLAFFLLLSLGIDNLGAKLMLALDQAGRTGIAFLVFRLSNYVQYGCAIIGLLMLGIYLSAYMTTTVGLTTRRLMLRKGVLFVKLTNIDLEEIKSEYVDHGMLGRFLNYGEVHMDARFVENFYIPNIADPYHLLRALNEARAASGDSVVAGEVPLEPVDSEGRGGPTEHIYVPAPPVPEVLPPEITHHALRIAHHPDPAGGGSHHRAAAASPASSHQPGGRMAERAPVITHIVVASPDGGAPVVVPVDADAIMEGVMVTPSEAMESETGDLLRDEDLDSVAGDFAEKAEPPAQVLDETDDYVIIKKKKPA